MFWPKPNETGGVCSSPGIYRITIRGLGSYVGRYTRASRPIKEYQRNVQKLLDGRPYRPGNPTGFRYVHHALYSAVVEGRDIVFEIIENVDVSKLNERERYWIEQVPINERLNGPRIR